MAAKTTSVLYLWLMHDLELTNLCLMFFYQNDLYFDTQVQNGYRQHTSIIAVLHVNYNIINNIYSTKK